MNTPKDEELCLVNEIPDFQEQLPIVDDVNLATSKEITATILGVHTIVKNYACSACKRKVNISANGKIAQCTNESCKMTQKATKCPAQWSLKLVLQNLTDSTEKYHLTAYHMMVETLLNLCGKQVTLINTKEELIEELLDLDTIKVSLEVNNNKMLSAEL